MAKNCAEFQVVCSRVTLYYNCRIELKWKRALHHCEKCDFRSDSKGWGSKCGAIHFGRCTPVTFPFPQSYSRRKGSQQSGYIPVAKVSPTRPATYAPHSNPQHVWSSIMSLSHYHWYSTDVFLHLHYQEIAFMLAFFFIVFIPIDACKSVKEWVQWEKGSFSLKCFGLQDIICCWNISWSLI